MGEGGGGEGAKQVFSTKDYSQRPFRKETQSGKSKTNRKLLHGKKELKRTARGENKKAYLITGEGGFETGEKNTTEIPKEEGLLDETFLHQNGANERGVY